MFAILLSFVLAVSIVCGFGNKTNQRMISKGNSTAIESVYARGVSAGQRVTGQADNGWYRLNVFGWNCHRDCVGQPIDQGYENVLMKEDRSCQRQ